MKRLRPLVFRSLARFLYPQVVRPTLRMPILTPIMIPSAFMSSKPHKTYQAIQEELERLKEGKKQNALVPTEQIRAFTLIQQRLKREILLSQQKTWFGRLAVRVKWFMIRGYRPFNTDDLSALFSWIIWGHILWIVLGTTTFLSLLVWAMGTIKAQDHFATFVANLVTNETGLRVVFEEAMVPDWKQRVLVFRKVFVSKRPGEQHKARIGNQREAAMQQSSTSIDDGNYTQFDVTIDSIAVSLSVWRWLAGKGIVRTAELKGVRGVVDRRHLIDDPDYDPVKHKNIPRRGDFHMESFKIDDMLVDVQFTTHTTQAAIFTCELPQLRKQWLLYDFMNADRVTGSYDNSLFTLHPRQTVMPHKNESFERIQRLRVDDVDVRNLNRGVEGMFGWIESGTVDFLADIMLPSDLPDTSFREQVQNIFEHWENGLLGTPGAETSIEQKLGERQEQKAVYIDLRVQFNNTRAAAPLYTRDLTYLNNALIHPIIAYINSRETYIPVHCRVIKKLKDFNGSWSIYDSTLMQDVSNSLYEACSQNAADEEMRKRRIRQVGFWSLQFLAQLVLLTLGIVA